MDAPSLSPAQTAARSTDAPSAQAQALEARITHARVRMLYGHMPVTAWTLAGFNLLIGGLLHFVQPGPLGLPTLCWLVAALVLAATRALHAMA